MVIISKDDYLSFMNEVGVRMQTPSVNVNNQLSTTITATVGGGGGGGTTTLVKQNNNIDSPLSNSQISLIPSQFQPPLPQAQTLLQQLQQSQQQLQQAINGNGANGGNNKSPQVARAVLVCRPNSHPFQVSLSFCPLVLCFETLFLSLKESDIIFRAKCRSKDRSFGRPKQSL